MLGFVHSLVPTDFNDLGGDAKRKKRVVELIQGALDAAQLPETSAVPVPEGFTCEVCQWKHGGSFGSRRFCSPACSNANAKGAGTEPTSFKAPRLDLDRHGPLHAPKEVVLPHQHYDNIML